MSKSQIKKKILNFERKKMHQYRKLQEEKKFTESKRLLEEIENRKNKYYELKLFKKKIKIAKEKQKELNKQFKLKRNEFKTVAEYKNAYKAAKQKRKNFIKGLKQEYKELRLAYVYQFETFSFKIKRWFFGMIKEYSRISWLSRKETWNSFFVVISITLFLSILFLLLNLIFAKGI